MISWIKAKGIYVLAIAATGMTFMSYQNCGRVQFASTLTQEKKLNAGQDTKFACNQPTSACEINGQQGTMVCNDSPEGPVWGPCILPPGPTLPPPVTTTTMPVVTTTTMVVTTTMPGETTTTTMSTTTTTTTMPQGCYWAKHNLNLVHGQSVEAYRYAQVPASGECEKETRTCMNTALSGSFQELSCGKLSGECSLAGKTVQHGQIAVFYSAASVPFGQNCQAQNRQCFDGKFNGDDLFSFANCQVEQPLNCNFNGQVVAHGTEVDAYRTSSVAYDQVCQKERRRCNNNILSGSYEFSSCSPVAPLNCNFNGINVAHNSAVTAYAEPVVEYNQTCRQESRQCTNNILSGSYAHSSCQVKTPLNCDFNGSTVFHNTSVTAYRDAVVPFGGTCVTQQRSCTNSYLSGDFKYSSCQVEQAKTCQLFGRTFNHGDVVDAFASSQVEYNQSCSGGRRQCINGKFDGNEDFIFESCQRKSPLNCSVNGVGVNHGSNRSFFETSTVPYNSSCKEELRYCTNGDIPGSYVFPSCYEEKPKSCVVNGITYAHGQNIPTFTQPNVEFGRSCDDVAKTATCINGNPTNHGGYDSCSVLPPVGCNFNGQQYAHNATVNESYQFSSVTEPATCVSQPKTCFNGKWSNDNAYASCSVIPLPQAQCDVYYDYKLNGDYGLASSSNGNWASKKNQDQNYNCIGQGCGFRLKVRCTTGDIRLIYQYKELNTESPEVSTPWSGSNGQIQEGPWAQLQFASHHKSECGTGKFCGLRVRAETREAKSCSVSYQYRAEKGKVSPLSNDGVWSQISGVTNGKDNCDDGYCGIRVQLNCQSTGTNYGGDDSGFDPGSGSGGNTGGDGSGGNNGGNLFDNNVQEK